MNKFVYPLVCLSILACSCGKKNMSSTISGEIQNAPGRLVYFEHVTDSGEVTLDSAMTDKEGRFELENKADRLDYYLLRVDATNAVFLVLSGGEKIVINGDAADLENTYTVSGSEDSELIRQLKKYDKYLTDSLFYHYKVSSAQNPVERDSLLKKSQTLYAKRMAVYSRRFLDEHPASLVGLSVTRFLDLNSPEDLGRMDSLGSRLNTLYPGNAYVRKFIEGMEVLRALPVGTSAPDIVLPDMQGKMQKLSSLRGKIVLVDFWASWCRPCRVENPKVVEIYKKFKSKGFEIFAVSLDDEKEKWSEAVRTDGLPWVHVSELKGWDSGVVGAYSFNAIPFTVLIDRKGKILDKGLRTEELEERLREIL